MDVNSFGIVLTIFLAIFTQSLTGFGTGLVSMALLPAFVGIRVSAPLVALTAGTLELALVIRYRDTLNVQSVWRLLLAALVGIPVGIISLRNLDERIGLTLLGIVLVAYPLYALFSPRLPKLEGRPWPYIFGFVAGLLGGAYNTSGPPVIIYGDSRRWSPAEFKANLQGFFLLNDALVIASHALSGNLTPWVWENFLLTLPAIVLGMLTGLALSRFINPALFRQIVLVLLIVLGLRMIASVLI
ncbi:MAG: sulfite exporter TauE/SafE family protein [Chloroflexota bacterium]